MTKRASNVERVFDEAFDKVAKRFPDFGDVELYEDDAAGADNGAGSERQFAYCKDGNPIIIAFAPKAEAATLRRLRGLMRHEFGHALEYRFGVKELEKRLSKKLPDGIERRADAIAEAVWGEPIQYDGCMVQCVGCADGVSPRPKHLPEEKGAKLRANPGTDSRPATYREVVAHLDLTDPHAIGGRAAQLPHGAEDLEWSLERWPVSKFPAVAPISRRDVRRYATAMRAGSSPPAVVVAEGSPRHDAVTGAMLGRGDYGVWDGAHRVAAAREAGLATLDAYVGRHRSSDDEPERLSVNSSETMIGYKVMAFENGRATSGADRRQSFVPRKGETISMPGKGIFLTPHRDYALTYYGHHDRMVLLTLEFRPADITVGSLSDREPEVAVPSAKIVDFEIIGNVGKPDGPTSTGMRDNSEVPNLSPRANPPGTDYRKEAFVRQAMGEYVNLQGARAGADFFEHVRNGLPWCEVMLRWPDGTVRRVPKHLGYEWKLSGVTPVESARHWVRWATDVFGTAPRYAKASCGELGQERTIWEWPTRPEPHEPPPKPEIVDFEIIGDEGGIESNPPASTRLVGYHGTLREMGRPETFKGKGMDFGPGFYFATDRRDAMSYTNPYHPVVYMADVKLENPILISNEVQPDKALVSRIMKAMGGGLEDVEGFYDHPMVGVFKMARTLVDVGTIRRDSLRTFLQKLGYDGVYADRDIIQKQMNAGGGTQQIHGDYIAVFSPEQILSWEAVPARDLTPLVQLTKNAIEDGWYFEGVADLIDGVRETKPDDRYVEPADFDAADESEVVWGRRLGWNLAGHPYVVEVPVEKVQFMEGNQWNMGHAAALLDRLERGERPVFRLPAGRFYRITKEDVEQSQRWYNEDELSYQTSMGRPWEAMDVGTFYVQLLDGNHRALAAMAAAEPYIYMIVGENYRDDVRDEEWVRP